MRYGTAVIFTKTEPGKYDETTGNYDPDTLVETQLRASVTNAGVETLKLIYSELKQGSLTIRLQRPYTKPFDYIRIGDKQYRVDFSRHSKVFVVSEVQQNGENQSRWS